MDIKEQLRLFLEPRSVAVIGVPRRTGAGDNVFENLLYFHHFSGRVYAVNPNATEMLGHRVYPSITEVPEVVDLAVVLTGRATVPAVVRQCVDKGIKAIVIATQGLGESDGEGKRLQEEVVRIARAGGARIIGPNAFGVANVYNGLNTAFIKSAMNRVPISSITQTGVFFNSFPRFMLIGKPIDLGNTCDIDFADALEYFEEDPDTRVIALHIEGIQEGQRFVEVASRVAKQKPVLVLKTGRSEQGVRVSMSHTGSLAGSDEVYDAIFRQCGMLRVADIEELVDLSRAFLRLPLMRGRRVAALTIAMSCGVMAADACHSYGLEIAELSAETKKLMAEVSPSWYRPGNPIDLVPPGMISGLGNREAFRLLLNAVLRDEGVDGVIFTVPEYPAQKGANDYATVAAAAAAAFPEKPLVCWLFGPDLDRSSELMYETDGRVTVFPSIERGVRALARLWQYYRLRREAES